MESSDIVLPTAKSSGVQQRQPAESTYAADSKTRLCFSRFGAAAAVLVTLFCVSGTDTAESDNRFSIFDRRVAASMPYINTNTSAAVMASSYARTLTQCSMQCFTQDGCIAFFYSRSLQRCRLLKDITLSDVADDSLYIVISGGLSSINIALYKPASASSEFWNRCCPASRAVDGQTDTMLHTNCSEPYPWLLVDLQYIYRVTEVTVSTGCNCCYGRMHDIDVRLGNTSGLPSSASSVGSGFFDGSLCYHRSGSFTSCSPETYICAAGTIGRYLSVQVTVDKPETSNCFQPSEIVVKGELLGL